MAGDSPELAALVGGHTDSLKISKTHAVLLIALRLTACPLRARSSSKPRATTVNRG
jgi:hypothetical protein